MVSKDYYYHCYAFFINFTHILHEKTINKNIVESEFNTLNTAFFIMNEYFFVFLRQHA